MGKQTLYSGMIRGSVTGESRINISKSPSAGFFDGLYFVMELEKKIVGIPDEILVCVSTFGYFRVGDRVILQGKIFKEHLKEWDKPRYILYASNFYNESIQFGD